MVEPFQSSKETGLLQVNGGCIANPEWVAPTGLHHCKVSQNRTPWRWSTERAAGTGATPGPAVNPWRSMPARRQYATMAQQAASAHGWVRSVSLALDGVVFNKCMGLVPSPVTGTNHARQHPGQCHHPWHPRPHHDVKSPVHHVRLLSAHGMTHRFEWAGQVRG